MSDLVKELAALREALELLRKEHEELVQKFVDHYHEHGCCAEDCYPKRHDTQAPYTSRWS